MCYYLFICRSQWPHLLRRRSAAARLPRSWVRIPTGAWMFVVSVVVLSGRGLCDELITRPEESYRLWCVVVCDLETSRMRRPWSALDRSGTAVEGRGVLFTYRLNSLACQVQRGHRHRNMTKKIKARRKLGQKQKSCAVIFITSQC